MIVQQYPNISVLDVSKLVEKLGNTISQMALVLTVMATLSVFAGLIVTFSISSHQVQQRVWDINLLKVLGASFNFIRSTVLKEFFALSVQLRTRWPGCFIPAIPEKKYFGGNDSEYVEERRQLLEKFLKDCSRFDYIIFSKEFKLFSRGQGEIDKSLNQLPSQTPL